jgi:hypothetical protein
MKLRLGPQQLEQLHRVGTTMAVAVPTPMTRRLVALGLMQAEPDGALARLTPAGLRALADAADAGRIVLFDVEALKARWKAQAEKQVQP